MDQDWVDDQTTLNFVSPEILQQEDRIAQQRDLIDRLDAAGRRDLADEARQFLGEMSSSLTRMRRDERAAKISLREDSFRPLSEEESLDDVMRTCPL